MSDAYVIQGGAPLHGEVACSGAKNSALKLLVTTLLAPGESTLTRVPDIGDVHAMIGVLEHLGAEAVWEHPDRVRVRVPRSLGVEPPDELCSRMRASTAVLGPLLARRGRARMPLPGGCDLGPRRIDLHMRGLEQLGATIDVAHGYLEASCSRLRGGVINLDYPSHGATENLVMAGAVAEGRTIIENASQEPEIVDLVGFLERMGARIAGAGTPTIEIEGVEELHPAVHPVMPDRLEAGTYLFTAAATGGDVTVTAMEPAHLTIVADKLRETGAEIEVGADWMRITGRERPGPVDISTLPYPGFPTDLQPLAVAYLARADGLSIVTENIFDGRFMFVDELARMGADVRVEGHYAVIRGMEGLTGAPVKASDLRAGAALVMSGLTARGTTIVEDVDHIERGYEALDCKLGQLGGAVRRVPSGALVEA